MSLYTKIIVSHLFNAGVKPFIPKIKFKTRALNIPKEKGFNIWHYYSRKLENIEQHFVRLRFFNCMSSFTNQPQFYHWLHSHR